MTTFSPRSTASSAPPAEKLRRNGCAGGPAAACRALLAAVLILVALGSVQAQGQFDHRQAGGLYGTVGVGVLNLERGFGMSVPATVTAISSSRRLVAAAAFDLGLLQGDDRDPRYVRARSGFGGSPVCVDTQTGYSVSGFRCSGGTDALHSFAVDLSYVPLRELWMGGRPGLVFTGVGLRLLNPRTPYATVGMIFHAQGRTRAGFKIAFGGQYLSAGIFWAYDSKLI